MRKKTALFISVFGVTTIVALIGVFAIIHAARLKRIVNHRPIIGILAQEYTGFYKHDTSRNASYFPASYVKFIEMGGAQVVPIMVNQPVEYYEEIFNHINGVLFPGGDVSITNSSYAQAGQILYDLAIKANDNGDHFPLWGTCLGFELLTALTAGKDILKSCNHIDAAVPIKFATEAPHSVLYGSLPTDVEDYLQNLDTTMNYHEWCLTRENFTKNGLETFYRVLSTNTDSNGLEYISTIEARDYPFFGVQFHPEKNPFEWVDKKAHHVNMPHTYEAVRVTQYFANFFVQHARMSRHKYSSVVSENGQLIYHYQPTFSAEQSTFTQIYLFPY